MKQSPSRAKVERLILLVAFLMCAIALSSCARQPRRQTSATELTSLSGTPLGKQPSPRLNINTAPAMEMEKLPGVGKIMAERIVVYREQYGPFRRAEHLMMVRGFSDHKFRSLQELITVE